VPALYQALYGDELGDDLRLLMSMDFNSYGPLDEALRTDLPAFGTTSTPRSRTKGRPPSGRVRSVPLMLGCKSCCRRATNSGSTGCGH
jgi:hypothetical protein